MTLRRLAVVVALVAGVLTAGAGAAAPQALPVLVYFTKGELFRAVERDPGARVRVEAALAELVRGPTFGEYRRGVRTSIPTGTRLRSVEVAGGTAHVDLSRTFALGRRGPVAVNARLAQLVFTATAVPGVTAVRLSLEGVPATVIQGVDVSLPLTRARFGPQPEGGAPSPPPPGPPREAVRRAQERLMALAYLPRGRATGVLDARTRSATLAFQKWEGLARDGIPGPATMRRLARAKRPQPGPGSGRRIEVYLRQQVALLVGADRSLRVIHVSTGAPSSPTPRGSYRVFRKEVRSWSVPFRQWLPWASYFTGGIAFHEYADVPPVAASHGCVRVPSHDAPHVYRFARLGTRVIVA